MTWNPSPRVADCREIAKRWNVDHVVIFGIDGSGKMTMATYGKTREQCAVSEKLGDVAFAAIEAFANKVEEDLSR